MKVAVLGCFGGMGFLFSRYFISRGHEVFGYDIKHTKKIRGIFLSTTTIEAVKDADVTVIATPIGTTKKVAEEISESLKEGSIVVELSSVKGGIISQLKKVLRRDLTLLSLHPLFGPSVRTLRGKRFALIGGEKEAELTHSLFPDSEVIMVDERTHDALMAYLLSLTHAMNLAYAATISSKLDMQKVKLFETSLSSKQIDLAKKVLQQDDTLFSRIQLMNTFTLDALNSFKSEVSKIIESVSREDAFALESLKSKTQEMFL